MYDSFDMACHDASSALQLNIKVNSENLLPNAHKYNVGSLRLPADPSWPKIPQRRMADDLDGIIEPPCVVTLTGTPRKSRTAVRASHHHQSTKIAYSKDQVPASFHHNHHKAQPTTHPLKRRPGCADPRFKRVTTVKSQVTSNDPPDRENHTELSRSAVIIPNQTQSTNENVRKTIPEKDTDPPKITLQETDKLEEIKGMGSIGVQTMPTEEYLKIDVPKSNTINVDVSNGYSDSKKIFDDETERYKLSPREIVDSKILQQPSTEEKKAVIDSKICEDQKDGDASISQNVHCTKEEYSISNLTTLPNNPVNVLSESTSLQYCQGNAGQFFLVVEKKAQVPSLSALKIDSSPVPSCQYTTQCYNVQVPVLTYQNLPLQISTQTPTKVDIPSQLSLSPLLTIPSTPSFKNPANLSFDKPAGFFSQISEEHDKKIKPEQSIPLETVEEVKKDITNSDIPEKSENHKTEVLLEERKKNCNPSQNQDESDKYLVSSDTVAQEARKTLGTPPIKLERKNDDSYKCEDVRIHQLPSDTTDSELYSIEVKQMKSNVGCLYSKEMSCSGSDCEQHFHHQSKFKNDLSQLKKKRRKIGYSSIGISQGVVCSRNYEDHCQMTLESSMDDQESIKRQENFRQMSRTQRKMKSEQNLSRYSPFFRRNYKNISDPHLALRESYRVEEETCYPSSYPNTRRKRENRCEKEINKNQEIIERTTDVESDVINNSAFCDNHRTVISINEESEKPHDNMIPGKSTVLPVKTQQLLNKSYMEYYDKLRASNIDKDESFQQNHVCQMNIGTPQLNKRRADSHSQVTKIIEHKVSNPENLTMEKLSALSNIINRNLKPTLKNSSNTMQTTHLYVNDNMKSSSDPTAGTESAVLKKLTGGETADMYDSSVPSTTPMDRVKRKRDKPLERRLLTLKTIAFFGFMMYAMIVVLPLMYNFFLYDDYEDYEDLSYIELTLEYVVSSFREAFGGLFDAISVLFFRPVRLD